jgi:hypothetical protein
VASNSSPVANFISGGVIIVALAVGLPYVVGFLFPLAMLPFYGFICLHETSTTDAIKSAVSPVDQSSFFYFLSGQGCVAPAPLPSAPASSCPGDDPQCAASEILNHSFGSVDSTYRGVHQFFSDDLLSRLFSYLGSAYVDAAVGSHLGLTMRLEENQ